MQVTIEELRPRVEAGAAWLDMRRPSWFRDVDLGSLRLERCTACILGQLYGNFNRAPDELFKKHNEPNVQTLGFAYEPVRPEHPSVCPRSGTWYWDVLTECWVTVILERRFAATVNERTNAPESANAVGSVVRT